MKKTISLIATLSLVLILGYIYMLLKDAGAFKEIHANSFPFCKKIDAIGAEDFAIVEGTEYIVVSSDPRSDNNYLQSGSLKVFSIAKDDLTFFLEVNFPKKFYPHGIDSRTINGVPFIFAINHPTATSTTIEIFNIDIKNKEIKFIKTLEDPEFIVGNDVSIINENEFLLTRDFATENHLLNSMTQYLRIPTGSVLHYDINAKKSKKVASFLFYANGIEFDSTTNTFFVSEMLGRRINSYLWENNNLEKIASLHLPHAIDNIKILKDKIIAAGHPKLLDLKKMRDDRSFKSPSVVLEIDKQLKNYKVIYENDGSEIASSSVALPFADKKILIGSVFDNYFLDCNMD